MLKSEILTFELLDKKDVMNRIMNDDIFNIYFVDDKQNKYSMSIPESYKPIKKVENIDFDFVKSHNFLLRKIINENNFKGGEEIGSDFIKSKSTGDLLSDKRR